MQCRIFNITGFVLILITYEAECYRYPIFNRNKWGTAEREFDQDLSTADDGNHHFTHHYNNFRHVTYLMGRHVCLRKQIEENVKHSSIKYQNSNKCKAAFRNYAMRCNGNQICKGVRLVFENNESKDMETVSNLDPDHVCCPGWAQISSRSHGCNKPICSNQCLNGGKCVKPELCACLKGFGGKFCEILINSDEEDSCQCKNGGNCNKSRQCRCKKGFAGEFCELDIDECKDFKPCDHICYNTLGSFRCQCKEDFILQEDGQTCRKEHYNEEPFEAKDLEYDGLDKRIRNLENVLNETRHNDVTKTDLQLISKDMGSMSRDIAYLTEKLANVENYQDRVKIMESKLHFIEKKADKIDDLLKKYDRMKKCAFFNKICI